VSVKISVIEISIAGCARIADEINNKKTKRNFSLSIPNLLDKNIAMLEVFIKVLLSLIPERWHKGIWMVKR
jgi:hypothetical protein